MAIKILSQRDYLLTEVTIELPMACSLNDLDFLLKTSRGSGKLTAIYQDGGITGVSIEQKSKVRDSIADRVRDLVGVKNKEMNGHQ